MIELIPVTDGDDAVWQKYFELNQEISRRHYPQSYRPGNTFENFRKVIQDISLNDLTYNDFILFEEGNPVAWLDMSLQGDQFDCGFDVLYDEIPGHILNAILSKINELMEGSGFTESFYFSYRQAIITLLKNARAHINEEFLMSRLERVNMDEEMYKNIVNNSELNKWKLECYNDIPDSFIEHYIECLNGYFDTMESLNPYGVTGPPYTVERWKKMLSSQKKRGMVMTMYILFDSDDKIAGLCSVYADSFRKETLRHNGGLTAVTARYRGRGIGKYLKAKLYLKLLSENKDFKYLTTDTMPWNKYMFKINEEYGFKPFRKGSCFKLTKEFLEEFLNLNKQ